MYLTIQTIEINKVIDDGVDSQAGGLALVLVLGGLLMYGLDCVRYDMKFPSRRHKRHR